MGQVDKKIMFFDVDDTVCPSTQPLDAAMAQELNRFIGRGKALAFISGSTAAVESPARFDAGSHRYQRFIPLVLVDSGCAVQRAIHPAYGFDAIFLQLLRILRMRK